MNKRSMYRVALVAAVVLTTSALVPVALVARQSGTSEAQASDSGTAGDLRRDKLRQALPGNGGEPKDGPGSAEASALAALAYPDTDIPLYRLTTARQAGEDVRSRLPLGGGDGWQSVGPSNAVFPFFAPRDLTTYLPNEYSAGGRVNAMALAPDCRPGRCRLWIGPAGGGVWRTNDALAETPSWSYLGSSFAINSIGAIALDPSDQTANTIWVATGEGNTCGSGCVHGVGLYKSTDGGDTWSGPIGTSAFGGRGVGSIAIDPRDPNVLYVSSTMGLHGMASVCCSGVQRIVVPGAALWGLYKSTDGGQSWRFIHAGAKTTEQCGPDISLIAKNLTPCTPRGVRVVVLDPSNPDIVYASSYGRGVWRSSDGGSTWTQIKASLNAASGITLPWIAVTKLADGNTRMYISEGNAGAQYSRVFRSDKVQVGALPTWTNLTSSNPADPRWGTYNFCGGQCWYDNFVYTPKGSPDIVYVGGSYAYGEPDANHRGVVLSTDAGASWTDMTADSTDPVHPNALHPDQHFIVTNPANPFQFIEANDGGVMRSSGQFANVSSWCSSRGLNELPDRLARCQQMLSRVPTRLTGLNKGLTTLQFQSLSVSPFNSKELQGGTQDNGTWENYGKTGKWLNTIVGDGGQSGFDVADRHFRFHNFYNASAEVNFSDGAMEDWNWIADPIFGTETQEFYVPMISDPKVSKTLFVGTEHVWRTKTAGQGSMTLAELRKHCNEWFGDFPVDVVCGDWKPLGTPKLTAASFGTTRVGGDVTAVARTSSDTSTLWAATSTGRVFVSQNAAAEPAASVSFKRIDSLSAKAPNRYVTSIYIDPANANHAWISYSGFSSATPTTPGHVFEVTFNPGAGTASWTNLDRGMGDLPITALVRDDANDALYAGTDYGVIRLDSGDDSWTSAASGMPNVEVPGLTIVPGSRLLYAATHGLGAWVLNLDNQ